MKPPLIRQIDTPEGRAALRGLLAGLPGLEAVLRYMRDRQTEDRATHGFPHHPAWHQRELRERPFFRVPCPRTACMIHSGSFQRLTPESGIFRFPQAADLLLVGGDAWSAPRQIDAVGLLSRATLLFLEPGRDDALEAALHTALPSLPDDPSP